MRKSGKMMNTCSSTLILPYEYSGRTNGKKEFINHIASYVGDQTIPTVAGAVNWNPNCL